MIRKIIYSVIVVLAIYFIATNYQELLLILEVFSHADGYILLLAILVQAIWLVAFAANFQSCYNLLGIKESISHLIPVTAAANFMNVITPGYGAGALAVFLADGHQRGKPAAKVSTSAFLFLVYDYVASLLILVPALLYLANKSTLDTVVLGAAMFAMSIGITLIFITFIGIRSADQLSRLILWFVERINHNANRFFQRNIISSERASGFSHDLTEGLRHISLSPGALVIPGLWAFLRQLLRILILFLVSLAFHNPFNPGTLLASYGVSYIFTIASITPSGVGFVEGAMGLTQNALGVEPVASAAIAIIYRGITFWLVLFYGLIAIRWVGYSIRNGNKNKEKALQDAAALDQSTPTQPQEHPLVNSDKSSVQSKSREFEH